MALKMQKELEMKLHEEFHKHVYMLTLHYPPSETFKEVFKKDMFVKSNKVGSQHVLYYLLEVLDKTKLKQIIKTWPLYDNRSEFEFRKEILKYINELNTVYEDADIPNLTTSHLISPGGFKFIKFMFKLSQFILYLHIQRNQDVYHNILLPLKPSKKEAVTKQNIDNMHKVINAIDKSTCDLKKNFEDKFEGAITESKVLMQKVCSINEAMELNIAKFNVLKDEASNIDSEVINDDDLLITLQILKLLKEKFQQCQILCSYLENPLKLEYNKNCDVIEDPFNRLHIENDILDFKNLLESFIVFSDRKFLEVKPVNKNNLQMEVVKFSRLNERLESMLKNVKSDNKEASELSEKLQKETLRKTSVGHRTINKLLEVDLDSDTELARPLCDSA